MTSFTSRATLALLLFTATAACDSDEEPAYPANCTYDPVFEGPRAFDDDSQLGFSGADVVAMASSRTAGALTWHDGATATITVELSGGGATSVFAPPPHQGYCKPTISVDGVRLRLRTSDGRLDADVMTTLIGHGYDGAIEFVFPFGAGMGLPQPNRLQIPAAWSSPERTVEQLGFNIRVQGASQHSPYCTQGESVSTDADDSCNIYDGVVVFHGSNPDAGAHPPAGSFFSAAVGWWSWS